MNDGGAGRGERTRISELIESEVFLTGRETVHALRHCTDYVIYVVARNILVWF